jgi:hypothetical protein
VTNLPEDSKAEVLELTTMNRRQYEANTKVQRTGTALRVGAAAVGVGAFVARSLLSQSAIVDGQVVGKTEDGDPIVHYGIKGMRWGVRRRDGGSGGGPQPVTVRVKPGKGIVKVKGGSGQLPSEDAVNAAAYKQKAKASGTAALDNKELQSLVQRMNLEQQYAKLAAQQNVKSKGRKFTEAIIKAEGSYFITGKKGPTTQLVEKALASDAGKKALKKAATTIKK